MRLTLRDLRDLLAEAFAEAIPDRNDVERGMYASKADPSKANKIIAHLLSRFPAGSNPHVSQLANVIRAWQSGKAGWGSVERILDALYGSVKAHRMR